MHLPLRRRCQNPRCRTAYYDGQTAVPGLCPVCAQVYMNELMRQRMREEEMRRRPTWVQQAHRGIDEVSESAARGTLGFGNRFKFRKPRSIL